MQTFFRLSKRLASSDRGVAAIEFALLVPVLAIMLLGVMDSARAIGTKLSLQQAINRGLEKAAVGTVQTNYLNLQAEVATAAGIPATAVSVDAWLECDRVRQSLFSGSCEENQMVSRYVRLTAHAEFRPFFAYSNWGQKRTSGGTVRLTAEEALRVQ
jgi:Flp pilus assembly pilin Flp